MFEYIKNFFRVIWFSFIELYSLRRGSRKLKKWIKKNKREQDPNLHPFSKRWKYIYKKMRQFNRRAGIKIKVVGEENIPNGSAWVVPNHTSNLDGFYLIEALGSKLELTSVARSGVKQSKLTQGYFLGSDSFYLNRTNIRESLTVLTQTAQYVKKNNRGVIIFPEGTRSFTTDLLEFKCGGFKFPQKYAIPILPITVLGTLQAKRFFRLKYREVKVIVHKPIKPIQHIKLPTDILCKNIGNTIKKELDKYEKNLSPKELKYFLKLKRKAAIKQQKKDAKLNKEIEKSLEGVIENKNDK